MGEALEKKFPCKLEELGVDTSKFPDKSFDGLFVVPDENIRVWLEWFCDNVSSDNVLSEEELAVFEELLKSGQLVAEEDVDSVLEEYNVSYNSEGCVSEKVVNEDLPAVLKKLQLQHDQVVNVTEILEHNLQSMTAQQARIDEQVRESQKAVEDAYEDLVVLNRKLNTKLSTLQDALQQVPVACTSLAPLDTVLQNMDAASRVFCEDHVHPILSQYQAHLGQMASEDEVQQLRENLASAKVMSVTFQWKVCSLEFELQTLGELLEDATILEGIRGEVGLVDQVDVEKLEMKIEELEKGRLQECCSSVAKTAVEELQRDHRTTSIAYISNMTERLAKWKKLAEEMLLLSKWLRQYMETNRDSMQKLTEVRVQACQELQTEAQTTTEVQEEAALRRRRYEELRMRQRNHHPVAAQLSDEEMQWWSCLEAVTRLLEDKGFSKACAPWKENIAATLDRLQQGPTRQLQLIPTDIPVKMDECRRTLDQLRKEVSELIKYMKMDDDGNLANHVWTAFLAAPEKLKEKLKTLEVDFYKGGSVKTE